MTDNEIKLSSKKLNLIEKLDLLLKNKRMLQNEIDSIEMELYSIQNKQSISFLDAHKIYCESQSLSSSTKLIKL